MKNLFLIFLVWILPNVINSQDLVAHYKLDGTMEDAGPNNFGGNLFGPVPTMDRFNVANSALKFDGFNDYAELLNQEELNFGECDFAISLWMKTSSPAMQMILHNGLSGFSPQYWLRLKDYSSTEIDLKFVTSNGLPSSPFAVYNNASIYNGDWHHVVIQRVSYWHEIYFDGEKVSADENSEIKNIINNNSLLIGTQHPHPSNGFPEKHNFFNGSLDDIKFFKGSLSIREVEQLFGQQPVSINEISYFESKVNIFPNPATSSIFIKNIEPLDDIESIRLINLNGQTVAKFNRRVEELDVSDLENGIYIIELNCGWKKIRKKFVKVN